MFHILVVSKLSDKEFRNFNSIISLVKNRGGKYWGLLA